MLPCKDSPNILLYSDPTAGESFGYSFDGVSPEGDVFLYTGEGQEGDQELTRGNRAVLRHRADGKALRLFVSTGDVRKPGGKVHRYIGEFEIDESLPYTQATAPDRSGEPRVVYVFRLRPLGANALSNEIPVRLDAPSEAESELVTLEAVNVAAFLSPGSAPTTAQRRESQLVEHYLAHLGRRGGRLGRWRVRPRGEVQSLLTDLYDQDHNVLYEAKGTATRDAVRRGIGQLLDYRRHISPRPRLALLLPHRPSDDLVDLIHELGIACVYEERAGYFVEEQPPETR